MKKNSEEIKFQIDQLKKDKMVCWLGSIAISILALLLFITLPSVFPEIINPYKLYSLYVLKAIVAIAFVYWLFAIVGNLASLRKIRVLQKELLGKKNEQK